MRAPYLDDGDVRLYHGDVLDVLSEMPSESVQTCVTSPPYWGLRNYGEERQIGLEDTPAQYVWRMVEVFRQVHRVLRDDGTLWLNLGDSYANGHTGAPGATSTLSGNGHRGGGPKTHAVSQVSRSAANLKSKDLVGIPWRVAFALQDDGWYLRSDIIWNKPNPMPESVTDRPTRSHEYVFLLTKESRYFYDHEAIREPSITNDSRRPYGSDGAFHMASRSKWQAGAGTQRSSDATKRNARSVWSITTKPYAGAHFATFPPELPERCIRAGSCVGDTVLDPFSGAGTTALVARKLQRRSIGIDLNADYLSMASERLAQLSLLGGAA